MATKLFTAHGKVFYRSCPVQYDADEVLAIHSPRLTHIVRVPVRGLDFTLFYCCLLHAESYANLGWEVRPLWQEKWDQNLTRKGFPHGDEESY